MPKKIIRASYPIFLCHPSQQNLLSVSSEFSYPKGGERVIGQGWLFFSAEFSYPEGVELLIGQGWREATTLSNRRMGRI